VERGESSLADAERVLAFGTFEAEFSTNELRCSDELIRMIGEAPPTTMAEAEMLVLADERQRVRDVVLDALASLEPRHVEFQWAVGDALARVEVWLFPWTRDGVTLGVRGVARDVTQQRLEQGERQRHMRLLDAVDVAVVGLDLEGKVTDWNSAAARLYDLTAGDAVGHLLEELVPDIGLARSQAAVLDSLRQRGFWEGEVTLTRGDGTVVPVKLRESHVQGPDGIPVSRASIAVSLAATARSAERRDNAQKFLATLTEQMADGVFTLDRDGNLTNMNPAAERLFGWRLDELRGRSMHLVTHYRHGDGQPNLLRDCAMTVSRREQREIGVLEDVFIRRDGTAMSVAYTCSPFVTDAGERESLVIFSDMTDRAEREARLRDKAVSLALAARIRAAIAEDHLQIEGRPTTTVDGEIASTKLSAHLLPEHGGEVPFGEFWTAAERHGLLVDIDALVVGAAGRVAAAGTTVAVSVAVPSLTDTRYERALEAAVEAAGGVPLILEIDERAVLDDESGARAFIRWARDLGCRVAVAAVGTGAVELAYLENLPVDLLEIDAALVSRPILERARELGLRTMATAVVDKETLHLVGELGIDLVRGPFIGTPVPLELG
jgi:PAS domain S-box-containing protein